MNAIFVANVSEGGKLHRLMPHAKHQAKQDKRTRCGWKVHTATAHPLFCKDIIHRHRCKKCFAGFSEHVDAQSLNETIEASDDAEIPETNGSAEKMQIMYIQEPRCPFKPNIAYEGCTLIPGQHIMKSMFAQ